MKDIAKRFPENPLLSPPDIMPSHKDLQIACLLNPGVFQFDGKIWMIIRVAERPEQKENTISFPILAESGIKIMEISNDAVGLETKDPRVINYKNVNYLTTLSHLRLVCSEDGYKFYEPEGYPLLIGQGRLESFGIEDCRVSYIEGVYYLTYTAVSENGVGVGMRTTTDWKNFYSHGMILPPHNKDCAIFEEKINGLFYALHRPSGVGIGGNYIWLASSLDGVNWGNHECILKTREGLWDSARIGAGASPIKTRKGWLSIYHGANQNSQYCLGAFLMDLEDPSKILARTEETIMVPTEKYELTGFFGNVVFTNGHVVNLKEDTVTIYYGASDEFVCCAEFSIKEIFSLLHFY
ncbi:glycoside hydrolase family 130 protein [Flavobacterium granuli]|uniref:GH43/DUF377 family glycosyl hydrolase n=1 Tax=Flavobacterium granuli TaxID=280093 RepID=A0ABU1S3I9_9FLAO|nr:glycoside hydrolase family 130 protein [Flavobacterium granuli]MDR6844729.1 putative GH43/DUF377 family glycosyl hydrolase [Flavobacterium granuli]